jgi:hypothetical protein
MTQILHGIVRRRTIELSEDLDAAEGEEVEITWNWKATPCSPSAR